MRTPSGTSTDQSLCTVRTAVTQILRQQRQQQRQQRQGKIKSTHSYSSIEYIYYIYIYYIYTWNVHKYGKKKQILVGWKRCTQCSGRAVQYVREEGVSSAYYRSADSITSIYTAFGFPIFTRRFFCSALSAFCSACVLTSAFALIIIPGSVFFCSAILLSDFAQTTPVGSAFFFFLFFSVVPVPGNKTQRFQNCAKHFFLIIFLYFFTLFITHKTHGGWWYMWR